MLLLIIGFIVGALLGSFVDCIANRSLTKTSFFGRSFCDSCKKTLSPLELIPIVSFIALKGRCLKCKKPIGYETFLIEVLFALLVSFLFFSFLPANFLNLDLFSQIIPIVDLVLKIFVLVVLVSVFITDIKSGLIPDRITFPSIIVFAFLLVISSIIKLSALYFSLKGNELGQYLLPPHSDYFYHHGITLFTQVGVSLLSGVGIGTFFLLLILFTKGRGMGGGDMKLGVFLGMAFGFPHSLTLLVLSFFLGSVFGIALLVMGMKKFGQTIPFGPFLSTAGIITLFWGEKILQWYLNIKLT